MYKITFILSLFLLFQSCDDNGHEPLQCSEGTGDQDNDGICDDVDDCIWEYDCDDCASNCSPISYINNIQNIFIQHCTSCHDNSGEGGLILSNYNSIFLNGNSGNPGVFAEDINQSEVWNRIFILDNMPPDGSPDLTDSEENLIRQWIEEGAIEE